MKFMATVLLLVTVSQAAQVPQVYAPNYGYTTALDVLNPRIPVTYSAGAYPALSYAAPFGYSFHGFPYNYGVPYPSAALNPFFHYSTATATPAVQAASLAITANPTSLAAAAAAPIAFPAAVPAAPIAAAAASAPAVIDAKAVITAEDDNAEVVEVDDTEVIIPDASIPTATGPLTIRRIFPVFDDALKSAGDNLRFVSPDDLQKPILPALDSPVVSVRKESEGIPTPSVITNNVLRTETISPIAPAGIVQATQPQFVSTPFKNSVISPFLSSLIKASPIKY